MGNINRVQFAIIILFITLFTASRFLAAREAPEPIAEPAPAPKNPFAELILEAQAAYVQDVTTGEVLFAKNETAELPLASLTKVMTAVVARELVPEETVIEIPAEAIAQEGDTGLRAGERWRLGDILALTLTASSNDGAYAIASSLGALLNVTVLPPATDAPNEETPPAQAPKATISQTADSFFVEKMNTKARELGMTGTFFLNESGLDRHEALSGAYGSAKDMAQLFTYTLSTYPETLAATRYPALQTTSLDDIVHEVENTNKRINAWPAVLASKTGFTDLAGGNLIVVFEAGPMRPIVVSVLGSSQEGRFDDVEKLLWASIEKRAALP